MKRGKAYNYDRPIRIQRMKANGLDIMFYTFVFSVLVAAIMFILCMKDGKFGVYFELWRVAVSIPLIIITYFVLQPLKELRTYVPLIAKKATWNIEELMALTKKDRQQTEKIMNRVLESAFVVDPSFEKKD